MEKDDICQQVNTELPLGPMPEKITFALFAGERNATPRRIIETEWGKLAEKLTDPSARRVGGKFGGPGIVLAELAGTRANANTKAVSALALDFDKNANLPAIVERLRAANLSAAIYTTHSHTEESHKFRAIVPYAVPLLPEEHRRAAKYFVGAWGTDKSCTDPARLFFLPASPTAEAAAAAQSFVIEGLALDGAALAARLVDGFELPAGMPARTGAALNSDLSGGLHGHKKITTPEQLRELWAFLPQEPGKGDIGHDVWLAFMFGAIEDIGPDAVPVLRELSAQGSKFNAENFDATVALALGKRGQPGNMGLSRVIDRAKAAGFQPAAGNTGSTGGGYIRADTGNAARFVDTNGHRLRVLPGGVWLAWTGTKWKQDAAIAMQCAVALARQMLDEAVKIGDESARKAAVQHALATNSAGRLEAMLKIAATDPRLLVSGEMLDADEFGLNAPDGFVDLKTGQILAHDPARLCTKTTRVSPDGGIPTPEFDKFIRTIFAGDASLVEYVLRLLGYMLTGSTREQMLAFLHGSGCNGKSTLVELLAYIMGDYAAPIDTGLLMESRTPAGGANPELLRLRGLRLAFATETSDGVAFAESRLKWLTGGDTLTARDLYAAPVSWKPSHKLLLSGNYRPAIRGQDHGIWRRIHLVPFSVQIDETDRDAELPAKLRAEAPGIFAKLVEACGRWLCDGLKTPAAVKGATAAYRDESDSIGEFLSECCEVAHDASVPVGQLYPMYRVPVADQVAVVVQRARFDAEQEGQPAALLRDLVAWLQKNQTDVLCDFLDERYPMPEITD